MSIPSNPQNEEPGGVKPAGHLPCHIEKEFTGREIESGVFDKMPVPETKLKFPEQSFPWLWFLFIAGFETSLMLLCWYLTK